MTLRLERVVGELPGLIERYRARMAAARGALAAAGEALTGWAADPAAGNRRIEEAMANSPLPYAIALAEPPTAAFDPPPFVPCTVVAADGSSIEPDRFAPVPCYVINTGWAVLPYGVAGEAALDAKPVVGPPEPPGGGDDDGGDAGFGGRAWGVNLQRDALELWHGGTLATDRLPFGPVVMLVDGTLLPWDLDSRQVDEAVRRDVRARTQEVLDLLAVSGPDLSVGAYVSGSRSGDVVQSLAVLAKAGGDWPQADSVLFARLLGDGQRSAVFRARSQRTKQVEQLFAPPHPVCFFYLRIGGDIARVETPEWAATPERLARLHAALVDQCARCGGYPRALQEAHEQAVISGADRLQFARLLENEAARHGIFPGIEGKQMSKRRRAV